MANINIKYGAKTAITVTLTSLAATPAGRQSVYVDNTANQYFDALVRIQTKGTAGSVNLLDVFVYSALGDTTFTDGCTGTDVAFTPANRRNAKPLGSVQMDTTPGAVQGMWSVRAAFNGVMPDRWGLIFINNSGAALSATGTDHVVEYEGVYGQSV
jgi:hypothetical protein